MTAPADIGAETPVLEVKSLTVELPKGTDRQFAVEEISFAVRPREIVCLVGESGSGKSVSAFSVMGLLPQGQLTPVGGEILLQGENVLTADAERLRALRCTRMSMIFQEPMTALNPVLTCGDQIDEVLRTHTDLAPEARRGKIIDIMNDVQLPDPAGIYGAYPHQLSGGQRQRIMIAMALVLDPVLLIAAVPSMTPRRRDPVAAGAPVLRTENLDKTYGGGGLLRRERVVHAAKAVNIEVRRGETLGIVGESGSGKSTVARCIARLIDPTGGEIYIDDDAIGGLSTRQMRRHRRRIQIVFQDPYRSLNPRRTVGDSIIEGPTNYGQSRAAAHARARELMELVQLDPNALDRYPHQFSGGQRQRICIARALAMEPELLIADEAVSALDVSVQAQVMRLLDDIRQRLNLAMLFITHDLRVAAQVCDRVAVMRQGEVVEYGPVGAIFGAPQHPYTIALFEAAPGKDWEFAPPVD